MKTNEEIVEQLTWYQINDGVDEIERGVSYVRVDELLEKLTTLTTKHQKELEKAVEAEQIRIARKMINASIIDEDEMVEEDFEGVSRVDAFMAGITHMHNAFRETLTPTKTDKQTIDEDCPEHGSSELAKAAFWKRPWTAHWGCKCKKLPHQDR